MGSMSIYIMVGLSKSSPAHLAYNNLCANNVHYYMHHFSP